MTIMIKGWAQASKVARRPTRTLRAMLRDRKLFGSKGNDGVWSFAEADLLAIAASGKPIAGAIPVPSPSPSLAGVAASPSVLPFVGAPTSAMEDPLAWAAAVAERAQVANAGPDLEVDDSDDGGADRALLPPFGTSVSPSPGLCFPSTTPASSVQVAALERRVAQLEADLARERRISVALGVGLEAALAGGLSPQAAAARDAARLALEPLVDLQMLADDGVAVVAARAAGMAASQRWADEQAAAWQDEAARHDRGYDDLARARDRRGYRGSRSRW